MAFSWTPHRFAGGLLCLDLVNTVVCRGDAARRIDRLADATMVPGFAAAASLHRAQEIDRAELLAPATAKDMAALLALREAVNAWMRPLCLGHQPADNALPELFAACAEASMAAAANGGVPLGRAAAISAMALFAPALQTRVKICPNCDWLFLDRSKNRSRQWCDMAVCGNRAKAKAHYRRHVLTPAASLAS